jgi:hypothetical protein
MTEGLGDCKTCRAVGDRRTGDRSMGFYGSQWSRIGGEGYNEFMKV